jgi:fructokinase
MLKDFKVEWWRITRNKRELTRHNSFEQNIKFIAEKTNTKQLSLKGIWAVLYYGKFYYNSGYFVKVVDTVGAGDSFGLTLLLFRLEV